jgi:hypothetical protein
VTALKNIEPAHYVDRLQDENDEVRNMIGWLSGHEPQLRMMIEAYKRYDGQALGSDMVGESIGEKEENIGDILAPPQSFHKNTFEPKPNPHRNRLDTTLDPPVFLPKQIISRNPSSSRVTWVMSSLGRTAQENTVLSPKTDPLWSLSNNKVSSCC